MKIIESCGCMTLEEMNESFDEDWSNCPYCGKKIIRKIIQEQEKLFDFGKWVKQIRGEI